MALLSPGLGQRSHRLPKLEWLNFFAHAAQSKLFFLYPTPHVSLWFFLAGSCPLSLNLFSSNGFGAPKQAPPKEHGPKTIELFDEHLDQPNNGRIPSFWIGPLQNPPGGQSSQPALLEFPLLGTQYSFSPQFLGLIPPRSLQNDWPSSFWSQPTGQPMHLVLGSASWGWYVWVEHGTHLDVVSPNFPLGQFWQFVAPWSKKANQQNKHY